MSNNYQARRALNVSAYLQNLNAISSPTQEPLDEYNPADDLTLWTDTTFFDFDMGAQIAHEPSHDIKKPAAIESIDPVASDNGFNDFMHDFKEFDNFDYQNDFTGFTEQHEQPQPVVAKPAEVEQRDAPLSISIPHSSIAPAFVEQTKSLPPPPAPAPVTPSTTRSVKRKASTVSLDPMSPLGAEFDNLEGASRLAAEEDKRRRNTAASARFRVKKKQKEQLLEKTAKEMTDRVGALEARIQNLEMENKWLKNLIVEKNGGKSGEEIMIPPTIFNADTDGVGTQHN